MMVLVPLLSPEASKTEIEALENMAANRDVTKNKYKQKLKHFMTDWPSDSYFLAEFDTNISHCDCGLKSLIIFVYDLDMFIKTDY